MCTHWEDGRRETLMRRRIALLIMAAIVALSMALGGAGAALGEQQGQPHFKGNNPKCQSPSSGETNPNCPGPSGPLTVS